MADRLKVFVNKKFTASDLVNSDEYQLITNNATTQAVVKDIKINGTAVDSVLLNDDFPIGTAVDMAGSEIVDTSKELKYKLAVVPTTAKQTYNATKRIGMVSSGNLAYTGNAVDIYSHETLSHSLKVTDLEMVQKYFNAGATSVGILTEAGRDTQAMSSSVWYYETSTDAFYFSYNGNNVTSLLSAPITNGVVGAWVVVNNGDYAYKVLDTNNEKVYWVDATTLYEYDMNTKAITTIGATGATSATSYTFAGICNGVFLFSANGNTLFNELQYCKLNTKEFGKIALSSPFRNGTFKGMSIAYNGIEDRYYIEITQGGLSDIYSIDGGFINNSTATRIGDETMFTYGTHAYQCYISGDEQGHTFRISASNYRTEFKWENNSPTFIQVKTSPATLKYSGWYISGSAEITAQTEVVDLDLDLECQISGIEVTEVGA